MFSRVDPCRGNWAYVHCEFRVMRRFGATLNFPKFKEEMNEYAKSAASVVVTYNHITSNAFGGKILIGLDIHLYVG